MGFRVEGVGFWDLGLGGGFGVWVDVRFEV